MERTSLDLSHVFGLVALLWPALSGRAVLVAYIGPRATPSGNSQLLQKKRKSRFTLSLAVSLLTCNAFLSTWVCLRTFSIFMDFLQKAVVNFCSVVVVCWLDNELISTFKSKQEETKTPTPRCLNPRHKYSLFSATEEFLHWKETDFVLKSVTTSAS